MLFPNPGGRSKAKFMEFHSKSSRAQCSCRHFGFNFLSPDNSLIAGTFVGTLSLDRVFAGVLASAELIAEEAIWG